VSCPSDETLAALVGGRLGRAEREELDRHIEGCRACAELAAELTRMASAIRPIRPDEEADLVAPPGSLLGRFRIERTLGAGGMGLVYLAWDPTLRRQVALKLVRARLAEDDARRRLLREAQALGRISHPNVVVVYEVGTLDDDIFLAMEYVPGKTLAEWQVGRPAGEVLAAYLAAGEGLAAVHERELVHRDFKPLNVLVGDDGRVRVADFGLARGDEGGDEGALVAADGPHTREGVNPGTPAFMAPEQLAGKPADARSDQYSFCLALSDALAGRLPRVGRIAKRGLAASPEARFPSMAVLLDELRRAARPRLWPWVVVPAAALAGGLAIWPRALDSPPDPCAASAELMTPVWGPARKARAALGFARTPSTQGVLLYGLFAEPVDRWSADWVVRRTRVCRQPGSERQAQCLGQRLLVLDGLLGVLETGDGPAVNGAPGAARALPDLASCESLSPAETAPPPPAYAARVEALRIGVGQLLVHQLTGRYAEGAALGETLAAEARRVEHPATLADVLDRWGQLLAKTEDLARAEAVLVEAAATADLAGLDLTKADAQQALIWIVGQSGRRFAEAHNYARYARAALARSGRVSAIGPGIDEAEGVLYSDEGKPELALPLLERALADRRRQGGPDDPKAATTLSNLAYVLDDLGRTEEALAAEREARALMVRVRGPEHPAVARVTSNIGDYLNRLGRYPEARREHEAALALKRRVLPPGHLSIAYSAGGVAEAIVGEGDRAALPRAEELAVEGAALFEKALGPADPRFGGALGTLGRVQLAAGKLDEAQATLTRALAIQEAGKARPAEMAPIREALERLRGLKR